MAKAKETPRTLADEIGEKLRWMSRAAVAYRAAADLRDEMIRRRDELRVRLDAGQGRWPGPDYVRDETFAFWRGELAAIEGLLSFADSLMERADACP